MICNVENGKLIIEDKGSVYTFEAHGEAPRPSMLGMGLSAAGKHWSDRSENTKLEKHTSIEAVVLCDKYAVWYTQEFVPDGEDYKMSKNAAIYLGDLSNGETALIYKGECYGDMVFEVEKLFFNTGNKIAVVDIPTKELTVLFKHSTVKKNMIRLCVTPKRIFYTHWSKEKTLLMWFDRESGEIVNPHVDSLTYCFPDENTVIFQALYNTWVMDMDTLKKKQLFTKKQAEKMRLSACEFFGLPAEYYKKNLKIELCGERGNKLFFVCESYFEFPDLHWDMQIGKMTELCMPYCFSVGMTADYDGSGVELAAAKEDIQSREFDEIEHLWTMEAGIPEKSF